MISADGSVGTKDEYVGQHLQLIIRQPCIDELPKLGDVCFRSKASWGYDEKFMEACRDELSFVAHDLTATQIALAEHRNKMVGVVQVEIVGHHANLLKLFVEPELLRNGIGRILFGWASDEAKQMGASRLIIESDPDAAPFYRRLGARDIGFAPSGSIPGRILPKLAFDLREPN